MLGLMKPRKKSRMAGLVRSGKSLGRCLCAQQRPPWCWVTMPRGCVCLAGIHCGIVGSARNRCLLSMVFLSGRRGRCYARHQECRSDAVCEEKGLVGGSSRHGTEMQCKSKRATGAASDAKAKTEARCAVTARTARAWVMRGRGERGEVKAAPVPGHRHCPCRPRAWIGRHDLSAHGRASEARRQAPHVGVARNVKLRVRPCASWSGRWMDERRRLTAVSAPPCATAGASDHWPAGAARDGGSCRARLPLRPPPTERVELRPAVSHSSLLNLSLRQLLHPRR